MPTRDTTCISDTETQALFHKQLRGRRAPETIGKTSITGFAIESKGERASEETLEDATREAQFFKKRVVLKPRHDSKTIGSVRWPCGQRISLDWKTTGKRETVLSESFRG